MKKEKKLWFCQKGATYYLKFQIKRPDFAIVGWQISELTDLWNRMGVEIAKVKLKKGKVCGG